MKLSSETLGVFLSIAVLAGAVVPAAAQTAQAPPVDLSVGYQSLHIPGQTYPLGVNVDASKAVNDMWRVVGEFGVAHDHVNTPAVNGTLQFYHFGVGPRLAAKAGRVRPYGQLIAGGVHTRADLINLVGSPTDDNDWAFMLQPGAGIQVPITSAVGAFGQVDYRRVFFKEQGDNESRFLFGLSFAMR